MGLVERNTKETEISIDVRLDGLGGYKVETGIAFFDHMLRSFCAHSGISISGSVKGDLEVDCHHTIEDCGIVIGKALKIELERVPRRRFGSAFVPMDEALCSAVVDISNRPFLVYNLDLFCVDTGGFDAQLFEEFWRAFVNSAGLTLHINCEYGRNAHHIVEASFKAAAHAIKAAIIPAESVLSTKGVL